MILPDNVFEEIKEFQALLRMRDTKEWKFSDVFNLLLRYCFDDLLFVGEKDLESLQSFFKDKSSILKELRSRVIISTIFDDYYDE